MSQPVYDHGALRIDPVCQMDLEKHVKDYLETLTASVKGEPHQQLLTTFLGQLVDLYAVLAKYWALSMTKIDAVAEDEGLKESIGRYAINIWTVSSTFTMKGGQRPGFRNSSAW